MRRVDLDLKVALWISGILVAGLFAVGIALAVADRDAMARCEGDGGVVERRNFRVVLVSTYCGDGCVKLAPVEVSDWRCAGLPAELPEHGSRGET